MPENPEFKREELISRDQLMEHLSKFEEDLKKKGKPMEEDKPATIFHTGTLSDEEHARLLAEAGISGEKMADIEILTIIRNFEADNVDVTVAKFEEIFRKYKNFRLITKTRLTAIIKGLEDLALGYKDKREVTEKIKALKEVLERIS